MTVILICEGRCNPRIQAVDDEVVRQRKMTDFPVGSEYLWALQRNLEYTPHLMVSDYVARCTVCNQPRRFGGSLGSSFGAQVSA